MKTKKFHKSTTIQVLFQFPTSKSQTEIVTSSTKGSLWCPFVVVVKPWVTLWLAKMIRCKVSIIEENSNVILAQILTGKPIEGTVQRRWVTSHLVY